MSSSNGRRLELLWVSLFLLYAIAVLLHPILFTQEGSFFIKQDNLHQAYPFYNKLAIALHKGYLPVWDANTYGGKNFAGELQAGIFYPVNVIWCWLFGSASGISTYRLDLLVCFHYLIAVFGMLMLARVFGLSVLGAIGASLVFGFAGAVGARAAGQTCIFFGLTLLPWSVCFVATYYLRRRRRIFFVLAGLVAGLEILAGHMQPFFHTVLIDGLVVVFYEWQRGALPDGRRWPAVVTSVLVNMALLAGFALLIALPQVYYSGQYLARCLRTVSGGVFIGPGEKVPLFIYSHWFIIQLSNLGNFLGQGIVPPDDDNTLYLGVLPLFLVIGWLLWRRRHQPSAPFVQLSRLLTIILSIGFLAALGYLTFFYLILYEIPFVNLVRQLGRYNIMISFSASLLAGLAITQVAALKNWVLDFQRDWLRILLIGLAVNALYWLGFQSKDVPSAIGIPFLLSFLFLLALPFIKTPAYLGAAAVAIIFIDLLVNPVDYLSTRTEYYPDRFYGRNRLIDSLEKTYGRYRVMFDLQDYNQERRNLGDLYAIQTRYGYGATINLAYANFIDARRGNDPVADDLLNVRYVLTDKNLDSTCIFKDSVSGMRLYERRTWYPRVYWKRQLGLSGAQIETQNAGAIRQLAYRDGYERYAVNCIAADTLIFSENAYPGWNCTDNGRSLPIYVPTIPGHPPLFRAVALGVGQHLLEFRYNKVFYVF
jgi:hypothetical protein